MGDSDWEMNITDGDSWVRRIVELAKLVDLPLSVASAVVIFLKLIGALPAWSIVAIISLLAVVSVTQLVKWGYNRVVGLNLNRRWQGLAWSHYREVLAEAMVRSATRTERPMFDFVTFFNGRFEDKVAGEFYSEIQYAAQGSDSIDLSIFDIEYLHDLSEGLRLSDSGQLYKLVPFQGFAKDDLFQKYSTFNTIGPLNNQVNPDTTIALPLRWGYNGVSVSLSEGAVHVFEMNTGINLREIDEFDLAWLVDESSDVYQYLSDGQSEIVVATLDWYLPTMTLLSWYLFEARITLLNETRYKRLLNTMSALENVLAADPFSNDPAELARRASRGEEELIVIGGGNWLNYEPRFRDDGGEYGRRVAVNQKGPGSRLKTSFPTHEGLVLWCECLGFLAKNGEMPGRQWRDDSNQLLSWFHRHRERLTDCAAFGGYRAWEPRGEERLSSMNAQEYWVRELPPASDAGRYWDSAHKGNKVTRDRWSGDWNGWVGTVRSKRDQIG